MTCFPIVLYPDALQLAWQQRPDLPELALSQPQPPQAPAKVSARSILVTLAGTLAIATLTLRFNPQLSQQLLILGLVLSLGCALWQHHRYSHKRRQWRRQQQRYEQQLEAYQRRYETHQQLCGELHHPMAIAQYQHQLVLAALQTATGYDKEVPPALHSDIIAFFCLYLEKYFPGKIKTNLAIYQPGLQDFHRCELAYIDDLHSLFIDIEIDEPYDVATGHPSHCQNNDVDGEHNDFFLGHGWTVMRFSEAQVVNTPRRCCRRIAQEIHKITIASALINRFKKIPELKPQPHWTWQEATQMAHAGSRDADLARIATKLAQPRAASPKVNQVNPPRLAA